MSIVFCVNGKFSAFQYCEYLNKIKNTSLHLITTYPYFHIKKYGLHRKQVTTYVWIEIIKRFNQKLFLDNGFFFIGNLIEHFTNEAFDYLCSKKLNKLKFDKLVIFSGSAKKSIHSAKLLNAKCFLVRGSAHILHVKKILKLESKKLNKEIQIPYKSLINRELKEYKEADKIIVHSNFALESFVKNGISRKKLIILPLGLEKPIKKYNYIKENQTTQILYLGQVSARKGAHYLLKVFDELNLKNTFLTIAGPIQSEIRNILTKYYINNKIKILGRVNSKEKIKLFKKAHIFCLPTLEDGFAKVILEAIEHNNYLLCSKFSAGPDIIAKDKNVGLSFNPRSYFEFKKKLLMSIKQLKNKKNLKIYRTLNNKYNWVSIANKFLKILYAK
jgi:glycosyltransferase involved in cell wall biosynthesis